MKNRGQVFLSAKGRKQLKTRTNQKEYIENNNSKQFKKSKYYNLSLNINNNNKERIYGLVSPKNKNKYYNLSTKFIGSYTLNNISYLSKKKKFTSLSTKNIFSTMNTGSRIPSSLPTVVSNRVLVKSPSEINHHIYNSRFFKIENEKLSQEIYYLKKDINNINKELYYLDIENKEKDEILKEKENEINSIINKNNSNYNYGINEIITNEYKDNNYNYYTLNEKEENKDKEKNINNNFNFNIIFNNISLNNYNYNNLFIRIRHQILKSFKEIKEKEDEIKNNKKSIFFTKMNEIDLEADLYKNQINKINSLIENAESLYERNQITLNEYEVLENKIIEQQKILNRLNTEYEIIKNSENELKENINKNKKVLFKKSNRKFQNLNLINNLNKKNDSLSKDQLILTQFNTKQMTDKIKFLKKNLELFKFHYKHTNNEIDSLKEKKENILKACNLTMNDFYNLKNNGTGQKQTLQYKSFNLNSNKMTLKKKVEELSLEYDNRKKIEKYLETQSKKYKKKFDKIINDNTYNNEDEENIELNNEDNNNDNENINNKENEEEYLNKSFKNEMTESNPYYSGDENNIPEKMNKFNKTQFITFEYILFKNFESKHILENESKDRIIEPLINIISEKNIKEIKYNSDSFNLVVNELTKLIMTSLENANQKNMKLITIFIGSLIHISNYNINNLIKYLNTLFSYTRNHSINEEKIKERLQNKYKSQIILLYTKLDEYLKNNLSNQQYNNYIPLLKVKEIIEDNNIQLKEKYCEYLYYYMKQFKDPNSNLDDLNFDLLNNLFLLDSNTNSNENDSVTEITNENYEKQLKEAIDIIRKGTNKINLSFGEMVQNITYKAEIDGEYYDYFTIENFNEELKKNKINLSDLQLSCLCNKYCLPENLKFINKNKIEKDIIQ